MTIKEIAKLAGVSISTVSKIVNNKADTIRLMAQPKIFPMQRPLSSAFF